MEDMILLVIGMLSQADDVRAATRTASTDALTGNRREGKTVVLSHFVADGLAPAAIPVQALRRAGRMAKRLVIGEGESPWNAAVGARVAAHDPAGLIVADLGTRPEPILPGCPMLVIDHHVPTGEPQDAVTIRGNGSPEPTTGLLAWWAVGVLGNQSDLLWLAALGLIGDMADGLGFPELADADHRYGNGRAHATGDALPLADWNDFIAGLGPPQAQVEA